MRTCRFVTGVDRVSGCLGFHYAFDSFVVGCLLDMMLSSSDPVLPSDGVASQILKNGLAVKCGAAHGVPDEGVVLFAGELFR